MAAKVWQTYDEYRKDLEAELLADDYTTPSESCLEDYVPASPSPSDSSYLTTYSPAHASELDLLDDCDLNELPRFRHEKDPSKIPVIAEMPDGTFVEIRPRSPRPPSPVAIPQGPLTLKQFWMAKRPPTPDRLPPDVRRITEKADYIYLGLATKEQKKQIYKVVKHRRQYYYGRKAVIYICKAKARDGRKFIVEVEGNCLKPAKYAKAAGARAKYRMKLGKRI
jgi:hypothetical protein